MEAKKIVTLALTYFCLCQFQLASSQSQPQTGNTPHGQVVQVQQHHTNQQAPQHSNSGEIGTSSSKTGGDAGYNHYTYRAPGLTGASAATYTNYPTGNFARDVYGTSRDASGNPIFQVASNGDFHLSAYFGQIFYSFAFAVLTLMICITVVRFFSGSDIFGGIVDKIKDSGATGKSMDLDGITNMVYQAFDTYGKWATKEARHSVEVNQKGR